MKKMKQYLLLLVAILSFGFAKSQNKAISVEEKNIEEKTAILVVTATPNPEEPEALAYYSEHAKKLFAEAGGKPISKYGVKKQLYGSTSVELVFIAEFPNEAAINKFFNTEEYKAILPYREKAFKFLNIYIANK